MISIDYFNAMNRIHIDNSILHKWIILEPMPANNDHKFPISVRLISYLVDGELEHVKHLCSLVHLDRTEILNTKNLKDKQRFDY